MVKNKHTKKFIDCYVWLYGETKKKALEVYKEADIDYIQAVIECFENNAKKEFYRQLKIERRYNMKNWYSIELEYKEAEILKEFLRSHNITFESSGCFNLVHFEILESEADTKKINEFLQVIL